MKPQITNTDASIYLLIPVGEWKLETIISRNINGSNEKLLTWNDFYENKPTGATEF